MDARHGRRTHGDLRRPELAAALATGRWVTDRGRLESYLPDRAQASPPAIRRPWCPAR
ncbi:MAG TPA: hypothetical protein VK908_11245 [Jiangellales bacterium]|nr:hypothetical protein [Jiangellales bacterium]